MYKIGIIGMGFIGTSLGLAIKRSGIRNVQIVGTDIERRNSVKAQRKGAIDRATGSLRGAAEDAQVVIIATPVMAMKDVMQIIAPSMMEGSLVTDTGDSKGVVLDWAEQYFPRSVAFVGGHPIVAKDGSGPETADASIFQDQPYCIIPGRSAHKDAVRLLTDMIRHIGAKPYYINLEEHDSFVAAVTQLPYLLSVALVGCTSKSPSWEDIAQVASTEYRNLTNLAALQPVMHNDIALSNDQGIVAWIDAIIQELYGIRQILVSDADGKPEALGKVFTQAFEARNRWMAGAVIPGYKTATSTADIPSAGENISQLFLGDASARRRTLGWGEKSGNGNGDKR